MFLKSVYQFIVPKKIRAKSHQLYWKLKSLFVKGNNVHCNCCGKSFSRFFDYGDYKKRENALCPNCMSLERTRILYDFLKDSKYLKNTSILHFAPHRTIEKKLQKLESVEYVSGDIDPTLAMQKIDITAIPYKEKTFDVIMCSHVLSVVKDDIKAIEELYRVLKPNGTLILQTYIYKKYDVTFEDHGVTTDEGRFKAYGKHYLQRCYGKDFTKRFLNKGFSVEIYDPKLALSKEKIKKYGMQNGGVIFLFTK